MYIDKTSPRSVKREEFDLFMAKFTDPVSRKLLKLPVSEVDAACPDAVTSAIENGLIMFVPDTATFELTPKGVQYNLKENLMTKI